jgi:hypothetical protein
MHPIEPELFLSQTPAVGEDERRERNIPGKGAEGTEVRRTNAGMNDAKKDALRGYPRGTEREKYRTKDGRVSRLIRHFRHRGLFTVFVFSKSLPINGPFMTSSCKFPEVRLRRTKLFPTTFLVLLNLVCFRFLFLRQCI